MWSHRKLCVKRHITNQHNGNAFMVAFIDYVAESNLGFYSAPSSLYHHEQREYQNKGKKMLCSITQFLAIIWRISLIVRNRGPVLDLF